MSNRLNKDREAKLQPERIGYAILKLHEVGIEYTRLTDTCLEFEYNGAVVKLFPYSGWHTGKSIKDGRGIEKLLSQLK